ncbi:MAG: D-alanyl-D-alanine carboxypeptidase [Mogibacterium sp.]|nr:D-alanyl-D-alanine carboxypeptidase [Mogibacterium sp.]
MKNSNTKRIRKQMVAIISVMLILVTTIGYIAHFEVYAEGTPQTAQKKAPIVTASSYMVMSGSTSEKVTSKHADRKMQPGKITMLMTAMVVLDNMYDESELKNTVETGRTIAEYGETFKEGEYASVGDLLNAMLVGGDVQAAELLAKYSASSRDIFVNEMNSKCMELGLMDTLFTNAGGRYDIASYSTAADLAVITQAAYRYQRIKDALAKKSATIAVAEKKKKKPREIEFISTNPLLTGNEKTAYQYIKGGILGLVDEKVNSAQYAAIATKDDMQMIVVLMDSAKENAAREATSLFEYADTKVTKNTIVKKGKLVGHARVRGGAITNVAAYTETKGFAYVPPEGSDSLIQTQVAMYDDLTAPLSKGDKVGEFRIFVADELKGTVDLIIKEDIPLGWYPSRFYISNVGTIVIGSILVLLLLFLLRVGHVKRRRAKRREAIRRAKIREMARMQLEIDEDRKRRDWDATGYEAMPPRTTDIRKEAINEEAKKSGKKSRRKK